MNRVYRVRFNEDFSCFAVAYSRGFKVFNTDPVDLWVSRDFGPDAGIEVASVLDRTNYLVFSGRGGRFDAQKLVVWNDLTQEGSSVALDAPVLNALVSRQVCVAVLENSVHVHGLSPPHTPLLRVDTAPNAGVASLWGSTLVVPGREAGQIQVIECNSEVCKVAQVIACHQAPVVAISQNRRYIATASATGTLVRVHDKTTGKARWFRRGLDRAKVWSLALSAHSLLAVLSDKGTLHVFDVEGNGNERHALAGVPFAPKYFGDEWSLARVKTRSHAEGVVGWAGEDAVVIVRPGEAQWEKYAFIKWSELAPEAWRALH